MLYRLLILWSKGEKVTVKAHGETIEIQGITVAKVDEKIRLQSVETWFDPMEMFRQIAKDGIVSNEVHVPTLGANLEIQLPGDGATPHREGMGEPSQAGCPVFTTTTE